jgi:hypothetical protein
MRKLEKLRAYIQQPERCAPRKKKGEAAAAQESARLAAKKIRLLSEARAMLKRIQEIGAAGHCTGELRLMRDELVEGLWSIRHTRREVKGLRTQVLQ